MRNGKSLLDVHRDKGLERISLTTCRVSDDGRHHCLLVLTSFFSVHGHLTTMAARVAHRTLGTHNKHTPTHQDKVGNSVMQYITELIVGPHRPTANHQLRFTRFYLLL